jgi:hypothetical protein
MMTKLSFNQKRMVVFVLFCIWIFTLANNFLGLNIFKHLSKEAVVVATFALTVFLFRVGPSIEEVTAYREGQQARRD